MPTSDTGEEPRVEAGTEEPEQAEEGATEPDDQQAEESAPAEDAPPARPTSSLSTVMAGLVEDNARLKDRLLRTAAEFENYKKRARRDMRDRVRQGEERVVLDFLGVADNMERALEHVKDVEGEAAALRDGVDMVYKQLLGTLERYNIKQFESVGEMFNPERHEAIQQLHSDHEMGTITFDMRKGYMRGDKLVRAAMVVVSKGPEPEPEPEPEQEPEQEEEVVAAEPEEDEVLVEGIPDAVDLEEDEVVVEDEEEAAKPAPIGAPPADDDDQDPGARAPEEG